jgi:SAM-dependent methyltransferase
MDQDKMKEFWDRKFSEIRTTWGCEPADSAIQTKDFFVKHKINNILIPGVGYGRNAKPFIDSGIKVTGIEISKTAIALSKNICGADFKIYQGSVTQMPFDDQQFAGIYCYALIHLLNKTERKQFIQNCYNQLSAGGYMIFLVVSTKAAMYGEGRQLSKKRYQIENGLNVYFYTSESATDEFKNYGLIDVKEYDEPVKHLENVPPMKLLMITCQKK